MNDNNIVWKHLKKYDKEGFQNDALVDKLKRIKLKKDKSFENFTNSENFENIHEHKEKKKLKGGEKKRKKKKSVEGFGPRPMVARIPPYEADEDEDYEGGDDKHFDEAYGESSKGMSKITIFDLRDGLVDFIEFIFEVFNFMIGFIAFGIVRTFSTHPPQKVKFNKKKKKKENNTVTEDEDDAHFEEALKYEQEREDDEYFYIRAKNKMGYYDFGIFLKDIKYLLTGKIGTEEFVNDVNYVKNKLKTMFCLMFSFVFTYLIYFVTFYSEYNSSKLNGQGVLNIFEKNVEGKFIPKKKPKLDEKGNPLKDSDDNIIMSNDNDYGDRVNFDPFINLDGLVNMFCDVPSSEKMSGGNDGGMDMNAMREGASQTLSKGVEYIKTFFITIIYFILLGPVKACEYIHWLLLVYMPNVFLGNIGVLPFGEASKGPSKFPISRTIAEYCYSNATLFIILFFLIFDLIYWSGESIKDTFIGGLKGEFPANMLGLYILGVIISILIEYIMGIYEKVKDKINKQNSEIDMLNGGGHGVQTGGFVDIGNIIGKFTNQSDITKQEPNIQPVPQQKTTESPIQEQCTAVHLDEVVPKTPFWVPETPELAKTIPFNLFWLAFMIIVNIIILMIVLFTLFVVTPFTLIMYLVSIPFSVLFKTLPLENDNIFRVIAKYILPFFEKTKLQERIDTYCELKRDETFELKYQNVIDKLMDNN
jgi:hypothetical protein